MLTALFSVLFAASAWGAAATSTFTATTTATGTDSSTSTVTATVTSTATVSGTSTSSGTPTSTRTRTATRTSSITMTFTRTFTPTFTFTPTPTHTRTSTPSLTITNTGTPSGQRIKEQQVEGFLTAVPTFPPAATSADLFTLQKMFAAQFERLSHGGTTGNWYDDVTQEHIASFFIDDTADLTAGNIADYAVQFTFQRQVFIRLIEITAVVPSIGGATGEVFRLSDTTPTIFLDTTLGPAAQYVSNTANVTWTAFTPTQTRIWLLSSDVGTPSQRVSFVIHYVMD